MNIIFGTKKLGQVAEKAINEKYPNIPVVTVEGVKEAKKSRRILFNSKAAELLGLESGAVQELVFGSVQADENGYRQVLVMNTANIGEAGEMVTYKTSKNPVAYEGTKEKGKAVTSSHMCGEIFSFLENDDAANAEFQLNAFNSDQVEAFQLDPVGTTVAEIEVNDEQVIETNNETLTTEEVIDSVQNEVAQAEANDPIFAEEEVTGIPQRQVAEPAPVEDWA